MHTHLELLHPLLLIWKLRESQNILVVISFIIQTWVQKLNRVMSWACQHCFSRLNIAAKAMNINIIINIKERTIFKPLLLHPSALRVILFQQSYLLINNWLGIYILSFKYLNSFHYYSEYIDLSKIIIIMRLFQVIKVFGQLHYNWTVWYFLEHRAGIMNCKTAQLILLILNH